VRQPPASSRRLKRCIRRSGSDRTRAAGSSRRGTKPRTVENNGPRRRDRLRRPDRPARTGPGVSVLLPVSWLYYACGPFMRLARLVRFRLASLPSEARCAKCVPLKRRLFRLKSSFFRHFLACTRSRSRPVFDGVNFYFGYVKTSAV
jgi:hypothetical protein